MLVYRVETETGAGPFTCLRYRSNDRYYLTIDGEEACTPKYNNDTHSAAMGDNILVFNGAKSALYDNEWESVFGCDSLYHMRQWFTGYKLLSLMAKIGFNVSVYKIEEGHVCKGVTQVIFDRSRAELIETLSMMVLR